MSKDKAYLRTDEDIQKALAELEAEGLLSKSEDGEGEGDEDPETNAKVEGGDDEGEEEGEETEKGEDKKEAPTDLNKGVDGEGSDDELQKAIDAEPILKAFSERQNSIEDKLDTLLKAVSKLSGNSAVLFQALNERVAPLESVQKAVEDIHGFSSGRRSMGAMPYDRFEKGGDAGATVIDMRTQSGHDKVLEVLEKALFDNKGQLKDSATNELVADMKRFSVNPEFMSKGILAECVKEGIMVKGFQ